MSNQPPPAFGGHPNFAQQWPPPYPTMIPPNYAPNPEYSSTAQSLPANHGQSYDFNMGGPNAESRLPGSSDPGLFLPPHFPFMGQFDASQIPPPPFPPMPMPSFGYPQMPPPPGSSNPPPAPSNAYGGDPNQPTAPRPPTRGTSNLTDANREEGEVSEGGRSLGSKNDVRDAKQAVSRRASAPRHSGVEEGETVSTRSRSSSRSSSPYNPPLSVSADPDLVSRAIGMQNRDAPTTTSDDAQPPRSATQLRVQAQGALLRLAPHNIRYDELVAEGINPTILKKLYEEVGIKVTALQGEKTAATITSTAKPFAAPTAPQPTASPFQSAQTKKRAGAAASTKNNGVAQKSSLTTDQTAASATPNSEPGKPMERKELIAKMLAAKAAKASEPSEPKTAHKETLLPSSTSSAPSTPSQGKENGAPVRQKNKAQTELARQRIEELKRQALLRTQQQAQQPDQSDTSVQGDQASIFPSPPAPAVQHPLPVRPPIPQPSEHAVIPGLLMTGSQKDTDAPSPASATQGIAVDSTPVARATQRKRPRASDFDEPMAAPKKHFSHVGDHSGAADRLIIDISDDESLYGDDEGEDMDVDSSPEQGASPVVTLEPTRAPLQNYPSHTRASTSTPQGSSRPGDQEHIRQRDLEIQAMHRKIAELEQKRKAKLATGRTQSPRTLNDSGASSSAAQSTATDVEVVESSTAPSSGPKVAPSTSTAMSSLAGRPNLINYFSDSSVRALASMDMAQLDGIRSKILRMKEIESGLPELDAELQSSESRLSVCREEADRLLSEIFKGREGRLLLIEELKNLCYEIDDLSLEDVDELRRQAELKEQHLAAEEAPSDTHASLNVEDSALADAPVPDSDALTDSSDSGESELDFCPNEITEGETTHDVGEPSAPSQSESIDSAMDESVDDSTSSQGSSDKEEYDVSDAQVDEEPAPVPNIDQMDTEIVSHHQTSESGDGDGHALDDLDSEGDESDQDDRDSSAESEAYEPPEPETGADSDHSAYSPPFSPAPPAPVEDTVEAPHSLGQPQAVEALTEPPQVSVSEPRPDFQIGILGNQTPSTNEQKFSSYVSPLRQFKAYRYHPSYAGDVSDGYRSLTYSHNIDSMKYLCPYEVAGGVCNDRSCEFQHFRDMTISDDKILIQMGAVREGQTEEEKETYLAGLKEIINEMRRDKVKDFSTVAAEIAAYRRRFLQDPSRVLPL